MSGDVLCTPLGLTRFPAVDNTGGEPWTPTWGELVDELSKPRVVAAKRAAPGWSASVFARHHRSKDDLVQASLLGYDLDRGIERDELVEPLRAAGLRAFVHSTWHHRIPKGAEPAAPRWRLILPLTRRLLPDEYEAAWEDVRTRLSLDADPNAKDASRFWFLPSAPPELLADFEAIPVDGECINVDELDLRPTVSKPRKASVPGPTPSSGTHLDVIAVPLGARLALLDREGKLFGRRNGLALLIAAVLLEDGLDVEAASRVLTLAAEVAASFGAAVDMDGNGPAGWGQRARSTFSAARLRRTLRSFGSLKREAHDLALALRRALDRHYLEASPVAPGIPGASAESAIQASLKGDAKLLAVTVGAGKSREARAWIADAVASGDSALVFVPTHELAKEWGDAFAADHRAVYVTRAHRSLVSIVGVDGQPVCRHKDRLQAALAVGLRATTACGKCPAGHDCAERRQVEQVENGALEDACHVYVAPQTKLAQRLRALAGWLSQGQFAPKIIVVDEPPPAVIGGPWTDFARADELRPFMTTGGVALADVAQQLAHRELASIDPTPALRSDGGREIWRPEAIEAILKARLGRDIAVLTPALLGLREALRRGLRTFRHVVRHDDGRREQRWSTIAPWVHLVREVRGLGARVVILDATADDMTTQAVWGHTPSRIHVADAPDVERIWIADPTAASPQLSPKSLNAWCGKIVEALKKRSASRLGVVTRKAWEPRVVRALRDALAGVDIESAHFGALRGVDRLADVDALVVVGEVWPDRGGVADEAAALDLDLQHLWSTRTGAELIQAEGRLRPVHRTRPAFLLRISRSRPDLDRSPQWRQLVHPGSTARGAGVPDLAREREALDLSEREHAELLGMSRSKYRRCVAKAARATPAS